MINEIINEVFIHDGCDFESLDKNIKKNQLSDEQMLYLARRLTLQLFEKFPLEYDEERLLKDYDEQYIEAARSHPIIKMLTIMLDNGFNPNTYTDSDPDYYDTALEIVDFYSPYINAFAKRLLLERGANPNPSTNDCESLFEDIDGSISIDINLCPYDILPGLVQEWLVLIGYGARLEKVEPFHLLPGHSYEELKEFWNYDYIIKYDEERRENIMHIFNYRTDEEIGFL